jgi:aspartyl/asparaginyl-tRNA synthetase
VSERTLVSQLQSREDGPVSVSGWVETVRDQKKVQFVILRDETGAVQLVNPATRPDPEATDQDAAALALTAVISELSTGTFLTVTGELKHDERVKLGGVEIKIGALDVASAALPETPIAADSGIDKRMDWRFIDLRQRRNALIFRIATTLEHAMRSYWIDRDYVEIHTPKLMSTPAEGNAELFALEYFGEQTAYLAQSPQHYKQMAQSAGFGKVFEIGDVFRADPSFTSRHATEFTSIDAEISWIDGYEDVAQMQEELLATAFAAVADKHGAEIKELFDVDVVVPTVPFPRIPLAEAREIVTARGYDIPAPTATSTPRASARSPRTWRRPTGTSSCSSRTTTPRSARSTTCGTPRRGSPRATTCCSAAPRSPPARSASTASTCSRRRPRRRACRSRVSPTTSTSSATGAAPRRLRDGPGAPADAAARPGLDPRGHVPLPRAHAPRTLTLSSPTPSHPILWVDG